MRRTFTLLLAVITAVVTMAGCGTPAANDKAPEVELAGAEARSYADFFRATPGYREPGQGQPTGTLNAGTNYVTCKVRGPEVREGGQFNSWWLKTDLDRGNPWQGQYVSAFALSSWGNDEARDNDGREIPDCGGTSESGVSAEQQPGSGGQEAAAPKPGKCATPTVKKFYPGDSLNRQRYGEVDINITACPGDGPSDWTVTTDDVHVNTAGRANMLKLSTSVENHGKITGARRTFYVTIRAEACPTFNVVGDLCWTVSEWEVHVRLSRSGEDVTATIGWDHPINNSLDSVPLSRDPHLKLYESS